METRGLIAIKSHKGFLFASGTPEKLLEFQLGELKLSSRRCAHVKGSKIRRRKKTSVGFASFLVQIKSKGHLLDTKILEQVVL